MLNDLGSHTSFSFREHLGPNVKYVPAILLASVHLSQVPFVSRSVVITSESFKWNLVVPKYHSRPKGLQHICSIVLSSSFSNCGDTSLGSFLENHGLKVESPLEA